MITRNGFYAQAGKALETVYDTLDSLKGIRLQDLDPEKTALIAVDMVNGFAKTGALYSPRIEALIPGIAELGKICKARGIIQLAFADTHPKDTPEFFSYPPHCLAGSYESELVEELQTAGHFTLIPKNSTNGFLEPAFQGWLTHHDHLDTFIVTGNCTDICIEQFATTLKCNFNRLGRPVRIIVPMNLVDTFDFGTHHGDLMHAVALMMLLGGGIEVVRGISYE